MKNAVMLLFCLLIISQNIQSQDKVKQDSGSMGLKFSDFSDPAFKKAKRIKYTYYESKNGAIFRIGDQLQIGIPSNNFSYVHIQMSVGEAGTRQPIAASQGGKSFNIKEIFVGGTRRSAYTVYVEGKFAGQNVYCFIELEEAIRTYEIRLLVPPNYKTPKK